MSASGRKLPSSLPSLSPDVPARDDHILSGVCWRYVSVSPDGALLYGVYPAPEVWRHHSAIDKQNRPYAEVLPPHCAIK